MKGRWRGGERDGEVTGVGGSAVGWWQCHGVVAVPWGGGSAVGFSPCPQAQRQRGEVRVVGLEKAEVKFM